MNNLEQVFNSIAASKNASRTDLLIKLRMGGVVLWLKGSRDAKTHSMFRIELTARYPQQRKQEESVPVLRAPRPLSVELRREDAEDLANKESEINQEIQTGDPTFDAKVYITTNTPKEVVQYLLAPQGVRDAALKLFQYGFVSVLIDDDNGEVSTVWPKHHDSVDAPYKELLDTFAKFVAELPVVEPSGEAPYQPRSARVLKVCAIASIGGAIAGIAWPFIAAPSACFRRTSRGQTSFACETLPDGTDCCAPYQWFVYALPVALVAAYLAGLPFRGRSDSSSQRFWMRIVTVLLVVEGVFFTVAHLRWSPWP